MTHWRLMALALVSIGIMLSGCSGGSESASAPVPLSTPATETDGPQALASGPVVTLPADSSQLRQIRIEPVTMREVAVDEVVAPGRVGIDPNRTSRLLLPVPGRIAVVHVKLGDAVEHGQPVVTLDSPEAAAALAAHVQAQATERQAEAALTKAEADYNRTKDLYEYQAVAYKDLVSTQNDLAQARGALEMARAATFQARRKLEFLGLRSDERRPLIQVRAPITGKVLEISVAPGEHRTDTSTPLMTIADLSRVWISSDVPETAIRLIHVGDQVAITLVAYPGEVFHGPVARIADVLDPQTRTLKVHVEMANPHGRFRPEMFGSIQHAGPLRQVPVLPVSALVQDSGRPMVFVERSSGVFERRQVMIGARHGDLVAVLEGLQSEERVVIDGGFLLKDW